MAAVVIYFSHAGENFVSGAIKALTIGNTAVLAEKIGQRLDAPLQEIQPLEPYATDYEKTLARSQQELLSAQCVVWRPMTVGSVSARSIFLGFPVWWGTLPQIVSTYLQSQDWQDRWLFPFCTHEGSGCGDSDQRLAQLCPGAKLLPTLAIRGGRVQRADLALANWLAVCQQTIKKMEVSPMSEIKNEAVENGVIFPRGAKNDAYAQYFIGQSYLANLVADPAVNVGVGNVTFSPGCRNNWHIHHQGYQILLVTGGEGWYQEAGQPARRLHPGDVVVTHDGVKHWHGATKDSWFSHIAITTGTPEWLEPVSVEQYASLDD